MQLTVKISGMRFSPDSNFFSQNKIKDFLKNEDIHYKLFTWITNSLQVDRKKFDS